jgi:hypothetical protein
MGRVTEFGGSSANDDRRLSRLAAEDTRSADQDAGRSLERPVPRLFGAEL